VGILDLLRTPATLYQGIAVRHDSGAEELQWAVFSQERVTVWPWTKPSDLPPGHAERTTHEVVTRYIPELAAAPQGRWKVRVGAREFVVIDAHDPMGRGSHLEVRCRRIL